MERTSVNDVPVPPLVPGDYVRLKNPYKVSPHRLGNIATSFAAHIRRRSQEIGDDLHQMDDTEDDSLLLRASKRDGYDDLFEFTHGTVAEVTGSYSPSVIRGADRQEVAQELANSDGTIARGVSLHLFQPETGIMYVGKHPTEPGKPEFVDESIHNLVLIHRVDETWGNEYELDLESVYEDWGILSS